MVNKQDFGGLILRITLGIIFFVHGIVKFQSGIDNIAGWFSSIGLPGVMAYGVALLEVVGGIALIIGLGTKLFSVLFALLMVGAIVKVKLAAGFLGNGQMAGWEFDLALLAMSIYLALSEQQPLSVDRWIKARAVIDTNKSA
ncbi:putative membrane protein YphA (DoxX/SURF4 family) [Anoxybacillus vitaminiphilus]|uniref:Putative membrane protein YphA (DoxX/SURF4 family) n=1 Tax=Paranoxybacillus vitaminiphilus TaxID=581036 RepID=A0A327YEZ2_9BACL|nr:DoxX family protein [Anoxybacillus vitaminiphilus]RAK19424.1 putative membrane protein YphA (DoxX/SURF4 family) [Anoxybacillus vitaminiphilus]